MGHTSNISFPGLGIGEFKLNNVAFTVFGRPVMWYGVIICIGIILAFAYVAYRAGKAKIKLDDVVDTALICVPLAIVGARLYYIIFYGNVHSFYDVIAIWNGGLAIYGGIIGGMAAVILVAKHKKIDFFKYADMIIPGVMIGQILGRWGNFFNGEAYGGLVSPSHPMYFLRMGLQNSNTFSDFGTTDMVFVHPTFLYESVWNLIGFILINVFYKKKKFGGEVFLWYLGWYGFGRFFIEQLRTDSLYIGNTGIRVSALLGIILFIIALPLTIVCHVIAVRDEKAGKIKAGCEVSIPYFLGIGRDKYAPTETGAAVDFNTEEFEKAEDENDEKLVRESKKKNLFEKETPDTDEKKPMKISFEKHEPADDGKTEETPEETEAPSDEDGEAPDGKDN